MKKNLFSLAKLALVPALAVMMLTLDSCKKDTNLAPSSSASDLNSEKRARIRKNVVNVLKDFSESTDGGSSSTSSGGSGSWSTSFDYVTYSTPSANVYQWSDPASGTTFQLSEATGGGGLGQLEYDGKSTDFNYVLYIKSDGEDATWDGFFNGNELRGVVAIKGEIMDFENFSIETFAIFLVSTDGGSGTYKFIDFDSTPSENDAIGEIVDLSDVPDGSLDNIDSGDFYITSNGHITVSESSFEMESDAKVLKVDTGVEHSLSGMIMFE